MKIVTYESSVSPITQTQKAEGLSDKYKLIRTDKVIEVFKDNGLSIINESVAKVRNPEREGFQKHLVAFTSNDLNLGDERLQLLLTNSHDGTSSYQLDLGAFRFACANGLVSGDFESTMRIRHTGNCLDKLDKAIQYQLDRLPRIAAMVNQFKQVNLSDREITLFTLEAAKIRSGLAIDTVINVNPRRVEDVPNTLWTVFNRVQEACLRGGLTYFDKSWVDPKTKNTGRWVRSRKITSVDSVMKVNKELWNLADAISKAA